MKRTVVGLLAMVAACVLLSTPRTALAHHHDDDEGGDHDHGHHYGWYKHHEGWRHHHYYDGRYYGPAYGYGYRGNLVCDEDGDDCRPVPPIAAPYVPYGYGGYWPQSYSGPGVNAGKVMRLQQTMNARLYANQALYQAAMAQGNYPLAGKAATRMQNAAATINATNSLLVGAGPPVSQASKPATRRPCRC